MRVVFLPGDCIGPEVIAEARRALVALASRTSSSTSGRSAAEAIRRFGDPLPDETLEACRDADAVLKGPIGDPEFDAADVRPEQGLLRLRPSSWTSSPTSGRPGRDDVDLVIVRELLGGLYYGAKGVRDDGTAFDTCEYQPAAGRADRAAGIRARPNARSPTHLGRQGERARDVSHVATGGPRRSPATTRTCELEHMLADNAAMQLVESPEQFDVIVTENMFGDILSDEAAAVTGGLGLAGSASLSAMRGPGLFEPVHGSAPDIAGTGNRKPGGRCSARRR